MSQAQIERFAAAVNVLKHTPPAEGVAKYGASFRDYDYFVAKHASCFGDTRGDQGHFSNAFITWHSLFLMEFERALLAVDPGVGGLPYWDWEVTTPSPFTTSFLGSAPGSGSDSQVMDGLFSGWEVSPMTPSIWEATYGPLLTGTTNGYNGQTISGYFRGDENACTNPHVTRYGTNPAAPRGSAAACVAPAVFPFMAWYRCIEYSADGGPSPSYHSGPHARTGGRDGASRGDLEDPITSPNDPAFMSHHANMDRSKMVWMINNADSAGYFYGYSRNGNTGRDDTSPAYPGLGLRDVVSSAWGFTDEDVGIVRVNPATALWSHADALCYLQPQTAPYTYE